MFPLSKGNQRLLVVIKEITFKPGFQSLLSFKSCLSHSQWKLVLTFILMILLSSGRVDLAQWQHMLLMCLAQKLSFLFFFLSFREIYVAKMGFSVAKLTLHLAYQRDQIVKHLSNWRILNYTTSNFFSLLHLTTHNFFLSSLCCTLLLKSFS